MYVCIVDVYYVSYLFVHIYSFCFYCTVLVRIYTHKHVEVDEVNTVSDLFSWFFICFMVYFIILN